MEEQNLVWGREIVFILDRSGSMYGNPMQFSKDAVKEGLMSLGPNDRFTICCYDDRQVWFNLEASGNSDVNYRGTFQANKQCLDSAFAWIEGIHARGLTDINTPFTMAVNGLKASEFKNSHIPIVFVMTDGSVQDETSICRFMRDNGGPVRCFTLGIGTYCNKFFLKMLAQIGKGYTDVVLYRENLKTQMISLMKKTFGPVLTEVMVGISGVTDCVVYPFPFPDLYIGSPLVLTGAFKGQFPQTVKVRGKLSNGNPYEFKLNSFVAERVPVKKVFYRMQIDYLISQYWLASTAEKPQLEQQVTTASCEASIPTMFTQTVAYDTTPEQSEKQKEEQAKDPKKRGGMSKAAIAGTAGVCVLGGAAVAALAFGNVALTASNSPLDAAFDLFSSGGFSVDFLSGIGIPDLGIDIGDIGLPDIGGCDVCAPCEALVDVGKDCAGGCNDICGGVPGQIANGIDGALGGCCSGGCDAIGGCCTDVGQTIGGALNQGFSSVCGACGCDLSGLGECGGTCFAQVEGCLDGLMGNCGDMCGNCGDEVGNILGSCGSQAAQCCSGLGNSLGNLDIGGMCNSVASCGANVCSNLGGSLGSCLGGVGNVAGDCAGQLGSLCGGVSDLVSSIDFGACLNGICSVAGNAGECLGSLFSNLGEVVKCLASLM